MTLIHSLELASPLIASAVLFGLVGVLRRLLRVPAPEVRSHDDAAESAATDPWDRARMYWGRWITRLLPAVIGVCTLALVAWFLAYLGWGVAWATNRPMALAGIPPWFGNGRMVIVDAFWGFLAGVLLSGIGGLILYVGHALGKCLIWPETCDEPGDERD